MLYIAKLFETALLETMHHHARFMARTAEPPGWTSQFRELVIDVSAGLHDLRGKAVEVAPALAPDGYEEAQALAASLRTGGAENLVYPSQRDPGGECAGLFHPNRASNLLQERRLDYHWNGARVDLYRDAGSGEIYRIS